MLINLKILQFPHLQSQLSRKLLYCDFNIANIIYENFDKIPNEVEFYADSTIIHLTLKLLNNNINYNVVSTDFLNQLLEESVKSDMRCYFFGDTDEILEKLVNVLPQKYTNIKIVGTHNGYDFNNNIVRNKINNSKCDILFVGLGGGIQEKWIIENYRTLDANLILTTGGWFKLLTGDVSRGPLIMRKYNLEWLYKLVTQFPRVWKRYLIGAPLFLYRVFISKEIILSIDED